MVSTSFFNLVAGIGLEPIFQASKALAQPLYQPAILAALLSDGCERYEAPVNAPTSAAPGTVPPQFDAVLQFELDAPVFHVNVAAPLGEEVAFRGFLFRGWVRSARDAMPAIAIIAGLFAILHFQYNWFGILQVFLIGLLLTWTRWRSGSTLLTMLMHVIANAYAMLQVIAYFRWFS